MDDHFHEATRPDAAQLEATKAEITAFREANPTLSRAGLAVAFVHHRGGMATAAELHTLLDLEPDQYVSVALASAVQNGRLSKDGKNWMLGAKMVEHQGEGNEKSDATPKAAAAPAPDVPLLPGTPPAKAEPKPAPAAPKKSRCRFALWSDSQVEIAMQGLPSVSLTLDEVEELVAFLTKIGERA